MKTIEIVSNLNKHYNFKNVFSYAILAMLLLFCFCSHIIPSAMGADSKEAPHISLEAKNQSLISVLNKITLDTGFKFKINDQWSTYPVNASFEDMPLGRGLKLILRGLNHSVIYEPGENIKIVIYGKINPSKGDANIMQPFSPPIRDIEEEPSLPESTPDEGNLPEDVDDNTENEGSPEAIVPHPDGQRDRDLSDQGENPDE